MKKLSGLLLALSLCFGATTYAQAPHVEKSEAFDEPGTGWNKVLQLKNGNTFFFHFTKKEGIEVNVFDKSHKVIATKTITSDLWDAKKMRATAMEGLYEINNEPVLFMVQADGRTPTLYRLRFNASTGDLVKEEEIGSLPKIKMFTTSAEGNDIFVEKDPVSDCYAVVFFNGLASDKDERIKVVHYDGNHKVLNLAYYESPNEDFRYLRFIGAVVDGSKRVFIGTYGARNLRGKEGQVYISCLNATDSVFHNKTLDFTEDFKNTKSVMYYNHTSNSIQLLTLSYARGVTSFFGGGATSYMSFLSYIDPETLALKSVKPVMGQKIDDYAHNVLDIPKKNYHGLPQQMIINKDNSTTILSEEITQEVVIDQKTQQILSARTNLGAIGISELNEDGTERTGYLIMKLQSAAGLFDPLYISARSKGKWMYMNGAADYNSFLSYDYVNTEKNRYILFNDNVKNFDKDEDERKRKMVVNVNKLNTVCYSLNGTTVNKFYLFGDPGDNDKSNSCFIDVSDFSKASNTYATVMIERDGRDRQARMVWVTFE